MLQILRKVFGSVNERKLRPFRPKVARINALEPMYEALSDEALKAKTLEFRQKLDNGASVDDLLPDAFATVREAAKRSLGQRHYDVQLLGGMVLHSGAIAEMRTGEGKTLVATLPVYLNALTRRGVHVVTVNDYLAKRDAEWMGQIYRFLGLSVGCIVHGLDDRQRREQYRADVTYGTNNEFGFDYLRDNMKYQLTDMVQRGHHFVIVDEVDSILVDEARTPLIISGPTEDRTEFYKSINALIPELSPSHYEIDEKHRSCTFTEAGSEHIEEVLQQRGLLEGNLYESTNISIVHHCNQALRAHKLFQRDKDYIVKDHEVILIDEFTGRMMPGRRLSEGLHQAIEAKEDVYIQPENQTLASITFQNYFRLYSKLAGMTGTASTEAAEFQDIYKLDVVEIPTNKDVRRRDDDDEVYRTAREKNLAIIEDIADTHRRGQPLLVGTVSIEKSEQLARMLSDKDIYRDVAAMVRERLKQTPDKETELRADLQARAEHLDKLATRKAPIPHQVLNARYHEQEARIIAQAGTPGAVTIATNMAGRGTDIQLGGNVDFRLNDWLAECEARGEEPSPEEIKAQRWLIEQDIADLKAKALAAGGLYVLGTERHESRRIDNQLRGRTGRQGDPGRSKFYICLEDDLLRIFAADRLDSIMRTLGIKDGEAIVHPWMSKALETSQKRVEQRNFEIRKNLLKYDNVMNDQRKAVFEQRIEFMRADEVDEIVADMRRQCVSDAVVRRLPPKAFAEQWDIAGLSDEIAALTGQTPPFADWAKEEGIGAEEFITRLNGLLDDTAKGRADQLGLDRMRYLEKQILLQAIDTRWREHLSQLDHLRSVIHLRGYAQREPLNEFKSEAFSMFEAMLRDLREDVTRQLMTINLPALHIPSMTPPPALDLGTDLNLLSDNALLALAEAEIDADALRAKSLSVATPVVTGHTDPEWARTPRNAACPCGSGRKYKHCHGEFVASESNERPA